MESDDHLTFKDALNQVGEAVVPGWDGEECDDSVRAFDHEQASRHLAEHIRQTAMGEIDKRIDLKKFFRPVIDPIPAPRPRRRGVRIPGPKPTEASGEAPTRKRIDYPDSPHELPNWDYLADVPSVRTGTQDVLTMQQAIQGAWEDKNEVENLISKMLVSMTADASQVLIWRLSKLDGLEWFKSRRIGTSPEPHPYSPITEDEFDRLTDNLMKSHGSELAKAAARHTRLKAAYLEFRKAASAGKIETVAYPYGHEIPVPERLWRDDYHAERLLLKGAAHLQNLPLKAFPGLEEEIWHRIRERSSNDWWPISVAKAKLDDWLDAKHINVPGRVLKGAHEARALRALTRIINDKSSKQVLTKEKYKVLVDEALECPLSGRAWERVWWQATERFPRLRKPGPRKK